jgi:hypothetical protein
MHEISKLSIEKESNIGSSVVGKNPEVCKGILRKSQSFGSNLELHDPLSKYKPTVKWRIQLETAL